MTVAPMIQTVLDTAAIAALDDVQRDVVAGVANAALWHDESVVFYVLVHPPMQERS